MFFEQHRIISTSLRFSSAATALLVTAAVPHDVLLLLLLLLLPLVSLLLVGRVHILHHCLGAGTDGEEGGGLVKADFTMT